MNVFIVNNYDDGVLAVFTSRQNAHLFIEMNHRLGYYHEEDCIILEEEVLNELPEWCK
jgi:hypothetical protein